MEAPFIDFDILKIKSLRDNYNESISFILSELPDINWDSSPQIKSFFRENFGIILENVKINHILSFLEAFDHDSVGFDVINGLVLYLRQKYTIKNYLNCVLKHEENGRVYLRLHQGEWVLPNKRPVSLSPEIQACVLHTQTKENKNGSNN